MSRPLLIQRHRGVVVGGALIAIALLVTFYSVVSGAVSQAAGRHLPPASARFEAAAAR